MDSSVGDDVELNECRKMVSYCEAEIMLSIGDDVQLSEGG
jgi:hypothetical protein